MRICLLAIQYHAVCGGEPLLWVCFSRFVFSFFYFFPNALLFILCLFIMFSFILFIFILSIFILILVIFFFYFHFLFFYFYVVLFLFIYYCFIFSLFPFHYGHRQNYGKKNVQLRQAAPASNFSIIRFFPIRVQNIP